MRGATPRDHFLAMFKPFSDLDQFRPGGKVPTFAAPTKTRILSLFKVMVTLSRPAIFFDHVRPSKLCAFHLALWVLVLGGGFPSMSLWASPSEPAQTGSSSVVGGKPSTLSMTPLEIPAALSLAEARRIAYQRNWDLLAANSDVELATAQKFVSREFPNPTLSLGTTKISTDRTPQSTYLGNSLWHRNYDTVVAIGQLFEVAGKRGYRKQSALAGLKAAEDRFADARRLLDESVANAYISVLLADETVRVLSQSAASLRREAEIAQRRLAAGDISEADKSQIEIAAERLELDANSAATNAIQSRISLEVLLGANPPKATWSPSDALSDLVSTPRQLDLSEATILGTRPDVAAAEAAVEKATADLKLQKALRVPDPTVQLQYEHEPPDERNTVGLALSFPLPLWNHNRGAIRAASAVQSQAEINAARVRAAALAQVALTRSAYLDSKQRWSRYRDQLGPKSAKVRETVMFAYEKGGASLLDLLSAERNDNEVRLATAQAMADTATKAVSLLSALNAGQGGGPTTPAPKP